MATPQLLLVFSPRFRGGVRGCGKLQRQAAYQRTVLRPVVRGGFDGIVERHIRAPLGRSELRYRGASKLDDPQRRAELRAIIDRMVARRQSATMLGDRERMVQELLNDPLGLRSA